MYITFVGFPWKQMLRRDLCVGSLMGKSLRTNTCEGVRVAGLARSSSWAVMH